MILLIIIVVILLLYIYFGGDPSTFIDGTLVEYNGYTIFIGTTNQIPDLVDVSDQVKLLTYSKLDKHLIFTVRDINLLPEYKLIRTFSRDVYYERNTKKRTIQYKNVYITSMLSAKDAARNFKNSIRGTEQNFEFDKPTIATEKFLEKYSPQKEYTLFRLVKFLECVPEDQSYYFYVSDRILQILKTLINFTYPLFYKISNLFIGVQTIMKSNNYILFGEKHLTLHEIDSYFKNEIDLTETIFEYLLNLRIQAENNNKTIHIYIETPYISGFSTRYDLSFNTDQAFTQAVLNDTFKLHQYDVRPPDNNHKRVNNLRYFNKIIFNKGNFIPHDFERYMCKFENQLTHKIFKRSKNQELKEAILELIPEETKSETNLDDPSLDIFREEINSFKTEKIKPSKYSEFIKLNGNVSYVYYQLLKLKKSSLQKVVYAITTFIKKIKFPISPFKTDAFYIDILNFIKMIRRNNEISVVVTGANHSQRLKQLFECVGIKFKTYGNPLNKIPAVNVFYSDISFFKENENDN